MHTKDKPDWCKDMNCKDCYRYNQCWACKQADLDNNRTCGHKKLLNCFECNIKEVK